MAGKKRILIISDSIKRQTGYATVATNIIKNLADNEDYVIAQLGIADVPIDPKQGLPVSYYSVIKDHTKCCGMGHIIEHYDHDTKTIINLKPNLTVEPHENQTFCPRAGNISSDAFAQESCFFVVQHFKPDIVIGINDVWGLYHINFLRNRKNFKFLPYLAVDSECFPVMIAPQRKDLPPIDTMKFIGTSDKVIVFTDWAKETIYTSAKIATQGKIPSNMEVIPHGVDRSKFFPLTDRKAELRQKYFNIGPDKNVFLLGTIQRNQPRKRLDAIFQVMRKFIDKYEKPNGAKIMCHFHTAIQDPLGWDLIWLATYYGVVDRCIFDDKLRPGFGVPTEILNEIINTYDVHISLTNSEGWGLPIIETMSAGIPNVVTDYSAHGDWGKGYILPVKLAAKIHEIKTNHIKGIADIDHAARQLSLLYNAPKMQREYSRKSIKLAEILEWSNVCEQWKEIIDDVDISDFKEDRYDILVIDPKEIKPIPSNPIEEEFTLMEV